jgi:hypothetical protein
VVEAMGTTALKQVFCTDRIRLGVLSCGQLLASCWGGNGDSVRHPMYLTVSQVIVAALLAACGGDSETVALPKASTGLASTTATLKRLVQSGSVAMVDKLFVSEVLHVVEGKTDYVLSSINCNKTGMLFNQKVVINSTDNSVQVVQDSLSFGGNSFNQCLLSSTKVVVRLPDGQPLDFSKLNLTMTADQQTPDNSIKILKIDFYRQGGRAGHGGNLALNSQYPTQNEKNELKVNLTGDASKVEYEILNINNQTIRKDVLEQSPDVKTVYRGLFTVPVEPFSILARITDANGNISLSSTELYKPQEAILDLAFDNAVIKRANQILVAEIAGKAPTSGKLTMRVLVPDDFSSEVVTKSLDVLAGQDIALKFNVTSPAVSIIGKQSIYFQYRFSDREEILVVKKLLAINTGE